MSRVCKDEVKLSIVTEYMPEGSHYTCSAADLCKNNSRLVSFKQPSQSHKKFTKIANLPLLCQSGVCMPIVPGPEVHTAHRLDCLAKIESLLCSAAVLLSSAVVAFATLIAWKLVRNANMRRGWRSQRDLVRTAFADISHQTIQHCKYAALMAKACSLHNHGVMSAADQEDSHTLCIAFKKPSRKDASHAKSQRP